MFGVGPGALPSDAFMMGIDPVRAAPHDGGVARRHPPSHRRRESSTWRPTGSSSATRGCSCLPYTRPRFEVAVAAQVSPSGPRLAGKHGLSLLSIGATRVEGYNAMETAWTIMEDRAAEFGTSRRPRRVAPRRTDAHRRDARAGQGGREVRPRQVARLLHQRRRAPDRTAGRHRRAGGGHLHRERLRRHRHAGRRDRADAAAREAVGRLRVLPVHGARLGRSRTDDEVLRAVRAVRHAGRERGVEGDAALPRVGAGQPRHVHAEGRRGDHELDPVARRRSSRTRPRKSPRGRSTRSSP